MLRTATDDDWRALMSIPVPGYWIGLAYEEDGQLLALGGAYEGIDGRWWAAITTGIKRPVALLKAAREILAVAGAAKVPLYSIANPDIPRADIFLHRLGFKETDERHGELRVLEWTP
jgi:hypothetical protein